MSQTLTDRQRTLPTGSLLMKWFLFFYFLSHLVSVVCWVWVGLKGFKQNHWSGFSICERTRVHSEIQTVWIEHVVNKWGLVPLLGQYLDPRPFVSSHLTQNLSLHKKTRLKISSNQKSCSSTGLRLREKNLSHRLFYLRKSFIRGKDSFLCVCVKVREHWVLCVSAMERVQHPRIIRTSDFWTELKEENKSTIFFEHLFLFQ